MLALGGGILSDCFNAEERGKAIGLYSLAPLLGPAVGPIAGGFITENTTWRWVFWSTTILCAIIQVSGLFFLQGIFGLPRNMNNGVNSLTWLKETYAPILLQWKAAKLRKETGNTAYYTEYDSPDRSLSAILAVALVRPFRLLATQPI